MLWIILAAFLIPLAYLLSQSGQEKRSRQRELDRIERRLAEKEAEAQQQEDSS